MGTGAAGIAFFVGVILGGSCCADFRLSPLLLDELLLGVELLYSVHGGGSLGGVGTIWCALAVGCNFGAQSVKVPP